MSTICEAQVMVNMPKELKQKLEAEAKKKNVGTSTLARMLIQEYLEKVSSE